MARFYQTKWWQRGRSVFRWTRILVWLAVAALLGGLLYLNEVGLPEVIKRPLLAELKNRGLDLSFARLRLHWYRGILAHEVNLGRAGEDAGPQLFIDEIELRFNLRALRHLKLEVESLRVRNAKLVWPLNAPDQPAEPLVVDNIRTELRLLPQDQWELDRFEGSFLGTQFRLIGSLTNASQWRAPKVAGTNAAQARIAWQSVARDVSSYLRQLRYAAPPRLTVIVHGDATDFTRWNALLGLEVANAQSPWGDLNRLMINAHFQQPPSSNHVLQADVYLAARSVQSAEGALDQLRLDAAYHQTLSHALPSQAQFHVQAARAHFTFGSGENLDLRGQWNDLETPSLPLQTSVNLTATNLTLGSFHAVGLQIEIAGRNTRTNWRPQQAQLRVVLDAPGLRTHSSGRLELTGEALALNSVSPTPWVLPGGVLTNLAGYRIDWKMSGRDIISTNLALPEAMFTGLWAYPDLNITEFELQLRDGRARGHAGINLLSRAVDAQVESNFDLQQISPWLRPNSQHWLQQFQWAQPPIIEASAHVLLPAWTNQPVDWKNEVLPTLCLDGHIRIGAGGYRSVPVTSAETHFHLSNLVWRLPDLHVVRPEGTLDLQYLGFEETQDYRFDLHSHIDPQSLRPLLEPPQIQVLSEFTFSTPPEIQGTVWGRWRDTERTGFRARVEVTNLVYRGEAFDLAQANLEFTNRVVQAHEIQITRSNEFVRCPQVIYDGAQRAVVVSNAVCHIDPFVVTRIIGPQTRRAIQPYQFLTTPDIRVDGTIPVDDADHSNLDFVVKGGPFHYSRFRCPQISGLVLWHGDYLTLTNMHAEFYQGDLQGNAAFDFSPERGVPFHFLASMKNVAIQDLLHDIATKTNRLEGTLQGTLNITRADALDWNSWNGFGNVQLQDGLIWDIPLFGILTPVLNSVSPGLGNGRFSQGTATFRLTNSVIYSRDLEIRAPALRLHYDGTSDFDGNLNARVEAELLRDTWLFGRILSLAFYPLAKLFEYKVTGTLDQPKKEPLYLIPRVLLLPIQPLRIFKEVFTGGNTFPAKKTNEPPSSLNRSP